MTRMHKPPHPGEVLREYLGDVTVTQAAITLGVSRQGGSSPDRAIGRVGSPDPRPDVRRASVWQPLLPALGGHAGCRIVDHGVADSRPAVGS